MIKKGFIIIFTERTRQNLVSRYYVHILHTSKQRKKIVAIYDKIKLFSGQGYIVYYLMKHVIFLSLSLSDCMRCWCICEGKGKAKEVITELVRRMKISMSTVIAPRVQVHAGTSNYLFLWCTPLVVSHSVGLCACPPDRFSESAFCFLTKYLFSFPFSFFYSASRNLS